MSSDMYGVGRHPHILTIYSISHLLLALCKVCAQKASHNLNITGIGVDHPIQILGSNYAFITSPFSLYIYIIPNYSIKVKLIVAKVTTAAHCSDYSFRFYIVVSVEFAFQCNERLICQ